MKLPNLPEVREAPLVPVAQEPRSEREMVSPSCYALSGPAFQHGLGSGWRLQSRRRNCLAYSLPKEGLEHVTNSWQLISLYNVANK